MPRFFNILNGRGVDSPQHFESFNPATGELLGEVAQSSAEQVDEAVAAARAAQPAWAARGDAARRTLLLQVADVIHQHAEELAQWVTCEQGKPLGDAAPGGIPGSRFELAGCEVWTRVPASLDLPVELAFEDDTRRDEILRQPYGVVAAIAPWNWPLLIAIWQIVPALRMGNTVVIKPSEHTPIGTLELVRLISPVLPPGVLNTVSGAGAVGATLVEHPGVDKILFTGSSATGAHIAASAARRLVPTTMELGGNDAAIVLPDVQVERIADGLFWGAFVNMGQTCAAIKRLYVHDSLHDAVVHALQTRIAAAQLGDGRQAGITMGPVQNRLQHEKVAALVDDARQRGGHIVCGGRQGSGPGYFYPLTLVTGLDDQADLVAQEQFGPALPVLSYRDIDEAIARANRCEVGLGASVWSDDIGRARDVAARLQAGTVWINQHGAIHPLVPFGGIKRSGWGVEFGMEGLKGVSRPQVLSLRKG